MSNFEIVVSYEDFHKQGESFWYNNRVPGDGSFKSHAAPPNVPCLVAWYIGHPANNSRLMSIVCSKKDAKRLVYPKTNGNRRDSYIFTHISKDVERKVLDYASRQIRYSNIDPRSPIQRKHMGDLMSRFRGRDVEAKDDSILIANYIHPAPINTVEFFVVTKSDAHKLVYYHKYIGINKKAFEFGNVEVKFVYNSLTF